MSKAVQQFNNMELENSAPAAVEVDIKKCCILFWPCHCAYRCVLPYIHAFNNI